MKTLPRVLAALGALGVGLPFGPSRPKPPPPINEGDIQRLEAAEAKRKRKAVRMWAEAQKSRKT